MNDEKSGLIGRPNAELVFYVRVQKRSCGARDGLVLVDVRFGDIRNITSNFSFIIQ